MQTIKKILVIGILFLVGGSSIFSVYSITSNKEIYTPIVTIKTSSEQYRDDLDAVFSEKLRDYDIFSYFPQIYEPSLQATYYALYSYNAIGELDQVDKEAITNYIMSCYQDGIFYDEYAYRYLDLDPDLIYQLGYYPLSSLLEINCYAVQSLALLNQLHLINKQAFIDFIWSCYNPVSDGFIGQPYDVQLDPSFKVSTMDNTYYAVINLDLLMANWSVYSVEKNKIIQFINTLQVSLNTDWTYGGFYNDENLLLDSIRPTREPSLLSSYYCIKTLEVFNMEEIINKNSFHSFLGEHYKDDCYFEMSSPEHNFTNIIATALGLELSTITEFPGINESKVINFLFNNRNSQSTWDSATTVAMHELMDTFQIIRSLSNCGLVANLTSLDRMKIVSALNKYKQYKGHSLISMEYTSLKLLNTIISSFKLFELISELELQNLYDDIEECFRIERYEGKNWYTFLPYIDVDSGQPEFRSHPIEYNNRGLHIHITRIDYFYSFKSMFFALDSMEKMFKLDDFRSEVDFFDLLSNIVQSQFLNTSFPEAYGGFVPIWGNTIFSNESQARKVFFEYSFYAIRCLEILANELEIGNLTTIPFNHDALYTYITNHFVETSTNLYFSPRYTDDSTIRFQNTYYMCYILKAMESYNLDSEKIRNYIISNLDYANIKNLYFAFKISKLLDLGIPFNLELASNLVEELYSGLYKEYYLTTDKLKIEQEVMVWIAEMIKSDFFEYQSPHPPPEEKTINLEPAIPLALVFIIVPGSVFVISNRQLHSKKARQKV